MANWLYIIDIKHLTESVNEESDSHDYQQFCKGMVSVLNEFIEKARMHPLLSEEYWNDSIEELREIREEFEFLMDDTSLTRDEVNDRLSTLYDWGDAGAYDELMHKQFGRMAWINHMFEYSADKLDEMRKRNGFVFSHIQVEA